MFKTHDDLINPDNLAALKKYLEDNLEKSLLDRIIPEKEIECSLHHTDSIYFLEYFAFNKGLNKTTELVSEFSDAHQLVTNMPLGVDPSDFLEAIAETIDKIGELFSDIITPSNCAKEKRAFLNTYLLTLICKELNKKYDCHLSNSPDRIRIPNLNIFIRLDVYDDEEEISLLRHKDTIYISEKYIHHEISKSNLKDYIQEFVSSGALYEEIKNAELSSIFEKAEPFSTINMDYFDVARRNDVDVDAQLKNLLSESEMWSLKYSSVGLEIAFKELKHLKEDRERHYIVRYTRSENENNLLYFYCLKTPYFICRFKDSNTIEIIRTNEEIEDFVMV